MPIGDMVCHQVGRYEIEFLVAERQLRSVDGEEARFCVFLAHRPRRFNLLRVDVYSRHVQTVLRCQIDCRGSIAAPKIQIALSRRETREPQHLFGVLGNSPGTARPVDEEFLESSHLHMPALTDPVNCFRRTEAVNGALGRNLDSIWLAGCQERIVCPARSKGETGLEASKPNFTQQNGIPAAATSPLSFARRASSRYR